MIGKHFIEVVEGRVINQGMVLERLNEAHYLLVFASQNGPAVQRVVPTGRMLSLVLFNQASEVELWLKANVDVASPSIEPGLPDELIVPPAPAQEAGDVGGE